MCTAAVIQADTRFLLQQMALPLIPQRRVKGALGHISRESGVSYSKLRKIYYALTDHILAFELRAIEAAHSRWLEDQERKLAQEIETLRALRVARNQGNLFGAPSNAAGRVAEATHSR